jgi:oligopeptide transport system ATP-binding protein
MAEPLIAIRDLSVAFPLGRTFFGRPRQLLVAVDGVTLDIHAGETVGLVGESGCGKSTLGRALLQLHPPGVARLAGQVRFRGTDLVALGASRAGRKQLRAFRRALQIIFQDPFASLNPRMTVGAIVAEPLQLHKVVARQAVSARVAELLELVGLSPAMAARYPHEFSGGQRQRIGIARAMALAPDFIVCDEPISALDVSIQAQIMNLLADLKARLGLTLLFIAHDLAAVRHVSDRIAVMYLGRIVELGPADGVHDQPLHPYTQALVSAVPIPDPRRRDRPRVRLGGEIPSPLAPPSGCRFHTRCPYAEPLCRTETPELKATPEGPLVACHRVARGERFTAMAPS